MDCSTIADFRNCLYACFRNAKDALMNVCDALLTETNARSFAELSLSPFFVRRWSSLYEAFDDATLDRKALQSLFVSQALHAYSPIATQNQEKQASGDKRLILAADATPIVRSQSRTARDRTYVHVPNAPKGANPVAPGWQFATVVALPETPSSWTTILDNRRIKSDQTASQVVAEQLTELAPQLPEGTVVTCDGGFGNPAFLSQVSSVPMGMIMRTANNRVLYRPAPPRTNKRGAPRKDGDTFAMRNAATHGEPLAEWSGTDDQGHELTVTAWGQLHFKKCRTVEVTLVRILRRKDSKIDDAKREPPVLWLIWRGSDEDRPPLPEIPRLYRLRYCIEHSYRFDKQELLWQEPRLNTPEKFEVWTNIVSAAHNEITLARFVTQGMRQPWESRHREPTPQQIRRACSRIIAQLGTPAAAPQVRGKSPGRRAGAKITKHQRFPTIFKQANSKKLV
jgi:hypothetical protein